MIPEQKQRIEQIRERQEHNKSAASDNPIPKFLATAYNDIDFLLSLVKSQEATGTARGATAIARDLVCNWRDEWRIPTPEPGPQLDSQSDLIARVAALVDDMQIIAATASDENPRSALSKLHKLQHEAAISMRSACVEKVKAMRSKWLSKVSEEWDDRPDLSFDAAERVAAADKIINALESLSIEKPKE